jgi:hypothetical protein
MSTGKGPVKITSPSRSRDFDPVLRIINSSNEGDPLKQVVVGRAEGTLARAAAATVVRDWSKYGLPC